MTLNTESLTREVKQLKREVAELRKLIKPPVQDQHIEFGYVSYLEHTHAELSDYKQIPKRY